MSNPLAVSCLAKLTNYFPFNGSLVDVHGGEDLNSGLVGIAYEAGYGGGQRLKKGARAYRTLTTPAAFSNTSEMTIGGLFTFTSGAPNAPEFGYSYGGVSGDEAFKLVVHPDGHFYVVIQELAGTFTVAADPLNAALNYPVTVQVEDSLGALAQSAQIIRIAGTAGALAPGTYFAVATKGEDGVSLFIDSIEVDSVAPPDAVKASSLSRLETGRFYSPQPSLTGQQNCFTCAAARLTAEEIAYLYNGGVYKQYADIVADAA